jgi:RNA polymerase sigma-70 factor (ECF subfamily)
MSCQPVRAAGSIYSGGREDGRHRSGILCGYNEMSEAKEEVTELLARISAGDRSAEESLLPQVYVELHRLAKAQLRSERPGHTLQATALVHEAYLNICGKRNMSWHDRAHFFRVAAKIMRRILTDYARHRNAQRRTGKHRAIPLDEALLASDDQFSIAIQIDDLLNKLATLAPRLEQVVEMRFFGGLTEAEIARILGTSERTVKRDWNRARAWLHQQWKEGGHE